jgi:hypothetical protein
VERRNGLLACCLAVLLMAPVLYVVASGPVVWLGTHGYFSLEEGSTADRAYAPLSWLIEHSPVAMSLAERWIYLWVSEPEPSP